MLARDTLIYILTGTCPRNFACEVYVLDHETDSCLFLKCRSGVLQRYKHTTGFRYYLSEQELVADANKMIAAEIEALTRQADKLRKTKELGCHWLPATDTPGTGSFTRISLQEG